MPKAPLCKGRHFGRQYPLAPLCKGSCLPVTGSPPKPSASGFGGERRCDGVSETCPASQGRGERYTVRTDETEGLSV